MSETIQPAATRPPRVVDASTLLPVGNLLVLVSIFVGGAVWVTKIEGRLVNIEHTLERFVDSQKVHAWVEVLQAKNPDMDIPDLR